MDLSTQWNPVPKPIKKDKVKKPRSSIKPKRTKKKNIKGKQAQRNNFSPKVRKLRMKHSGGVCEYCESRKATELHHVKRKGFSGKGRGVFTNAMYLCWHCHHNIVHNPKDNSIEKKLMIEYEKTYGKYYYLDSKDIEQIHPDDIDKKALKRWEHYNKGE